MHIYKSLMENGPVKLQNKIHIRLQRWLQVKGCFVFLALQMQIMRNKCWRWKVWSQRETSPQVKASLKNCADWCKKRKKCTAGLLTESSLHKIISKEILYLFITTSVPDFLPQLVLTDWPFAALAPSHRWHLHLSQPEHWEGEGESVQTTILHKELQNESRKRCL